MVQEKAQMSSESSFLAGKGKGLEDIEIVDRDL